MLAAAGGTLGAGLACAAIAALARFGPSDVPRLRMIQVDGQVLVYTAAATLASALVFGLAPALRLARTGVSDSLKEGGRGVAGSSHQRMQRVLAATEVALALVLVVASGAAMTGAGLAAGLALAIGSTRLLASLLYGVTPLDPPTFGGVAAVLAAAAAGAACLPARRATRISAATALRGAD